MRLLFLMGARAETCLEFWRASRHFFLTARWWLVWGSLTGRRICLDSVHRCVALRANKKVARLVVCFIESVMRYSFI